MFDKKNLTPINNIEIGLDEHAFDGMQRQGMTLYQALFELIDNALAATKQNTQSRIALALAPDESPEYFWLGCFDWNGGMDKEALRHGMQIGCKPSGQNWLNDHGFGMKNAILAMALNDTFMIYTRKDTNNYLLLTNPLSLNMPLYSVPDLDLPAGMNTKWENPSTAILCRVPMSFTATLQRDGQQPLSDLAEIRNWIVEHVGVTYRGYLENDPTTAEPYAKIAVTIGNNENFITPIEVPLMMTQTEHIEVELGGTVMTLQYKHGQLDESLRDTLVLGKPTQFNYLGNQTTQGIDIRIGKRVISLAQLPKIWKKRGGKPEPRHNHYNYFLGELLIPELPGDVLSTLWNKSDLYYEDFNWKAIFSALQKFPPEKHDRALREEEVKKHWAEMLEAACPGDRISREVNIWCTGTRIDVLHESDTKCVVYEVKVRKAAPLNLYQLRMYWDGLVMNGVQPTDGVLIAANYSGNLQKMVDALNLMPPPCFPDGSASKPYNFSLSTLKKKHLDELSFDDHP